MLPKSSKNNPPLKTLNDPLISPYMQKCPKNVAQITQKWHTFIPYMRLGSENVTKITQKWWWWKMLKMSPNFPLYAKMVENVDTNHVKMTTTFPLICKMARKMWHKWWKMATIKKCKMTPWFPLICENDEKCWHKSPKKWPKYFPYMHFVRKFVTIIVKIDTPTPEWNWPSFPPYMHFVWNFVTFIAQNRPVNFPIMHFVVEFVTELCTLGN